MAEVGKTVAFLALRAGSRGIPGKNVRLFSGKPLFVWVVEAAIDSKVVDDVYISTDDDAVRTLVGSHAWPRVHLVERSPETATDSASTESALLEFASSVRFETVMMLQATSPLVRGADLRRGLELFQRSRADSVVSCVRQRRFLWQSKDGWGIPVNYSPLHRPRRQELEGILVENGALYICRRDGLLASKARLFGRIAVLEMDERTYLEVDEPTDWLALEAIARDGKQL